MRISGTNQESNQVYNRSLVLRSIQHVRHCSRVELAKWTGLKQATISHIINDFLQWRLVEETGSFSGTKGRRTIGVQLSDEKYRVIGFRLTRRHYMIGVFTLGCNEVGDRITVDITDSSPEIIIESVCDKINEIIAAHSAYRFLAVGVSVPGPYYQDSGEIALISGFPGWRNIKIREIMQSRIAIPVIVDHDANAGVLAESTLVEGRDIYGTMVYVSAGQGIGAGIVNNGEVYTGAFGIAGEIGHTSVDLHGPLCECGRRGCLTLHASTVALTNQVRAKLGRDELSFKEVVPLIQNGCAEAVEAFANTMKYMSAGIINLIYTYNPNCIIIGDALSSIGQPILDELNRALQTMNVARLRNSVKIELARLGFDSAYIGAALIATRYVFDNVITMCNNIDRDDQDRSDRRV